MLGTIGMNASIAGLTISAAVTRTGGGAESHEIALPAGFSGSAAWGGSSAVISGLPTGHGITVSTKVGVFWGTSSRRLTMTVSAANANDITVTNSTGDGDALPTSSTATVVVSAEADVQDLIFDYAALKMYVVTCDQIAALRLMDGTTTTRLITDVRNSGDMYWWAYGLGTNPLSADVAQGKAYNGSTTAATMKVGVLTTT